MGPNRNEVGSLGLSHGEFNIHLFRICLPSTIVKIPWLKVKQI